jgi:hypothetical protein
LRAARANRVFGRDEKHIRSEDTVLVNTKQGVGVLYKIVDCARMCFSSVRNQRSARTVSRPRKSKLHKNGKCDFVTTYIHNLMRTGATCLPACC